MGVQRSEEQGQLVRRVIESFARVQIASINILGHCLKYVGDIETKLRMASELDLSLRLFREMGELHRELGWEELDRAVRERLERIPYPQSRQEFGVAYFILGTAQRVAMESYVDSSSREFAAIARTYVDNARQRPEPKRFIEYASDPTNRPQAQQFLNRWLEVTLDSFGRPGTPGDRLAVEMGLRSRSSAEMRGAFLVQLHPFLQSTGLDMPSFAGTGGEGPAAE